MKHTIHNLVQGSPEWLAYRANPDCYNASDAPAVMGCSSYKTRSQLLHEKHTGLTPDVDAGTQRRFDDGHRFEALARPLAEKIIDADLYPVVASLGKFSASFDGLTMLGDTAFEHKTLNDELRACMKDEGNGYGLPLQYQVQMEQQLMVSGAERVLFMASKWDGDELIEERHCWYASDPKLRSQIVAGWAQFEQDLAAYAPAEKTVAPVGAAVTALPAVSVQVTGSIAIKDNFKAFEVALTDFIEHRLIRKPETDQDFADLDTQIKALKGAEFALDALEVQMLSQVEAVDQAKRTKDMLLKMARENRLMAEKLLAARKDQIKVEQVQRGQKALAEHVAGLNQRLGKAYMPVVQADFGGAVKGKRTVASLQDAVDTELARAKIEASATADKIGLNLMTLRDLAKNHVFLFFDAGEIILKAPDHLMMLVKSRIAEHQAEEEKRIEAETARIRAEEQAKAEKEAREKLEREQAEARRKEESEVTTGVMEGLAGARQEESLPLPLIDALEGVATHLIADMAVSRAAETSKPAANVVRLPTPQESATRILSAYLPEVQKTPPTLKLGQIGERLGFSLTGDFLKNIGFEPSARDKSALLFHEADFPLICMRLVSHIQHVQAKQAA